MPLYCVDVLATHLPEDQISSAMALESVTDQKLSVYLASNSVQEYLWPERRMIVDMVPLRTIETNITYMRGPEEFTAIFSDIRTENDKCCGLLSFGTVFKVQKHPYHMNLDIFGSDTRTLMEHIVRHLLVLKSKVKGEAAVLAMVQEDYDMEKLDSVFKSFGVERKIWFDSTYPSLRYSKLYLYERDALTS